MMATPRHVLVIGASGVIGGAHIGNLAPRGHRPGPVAATGTGTGREHTLTGA